MKTKKWFIIGMTLAAACPPAEAESEREGISWQEYLPVTVSLDAFADVESAYYARGAIVDKRPISSQYVNAAFDAGPFGRIGGYVWCVCSMSHSGQSAKKRLAYNDVEYNLYYGYDFQLAEDWTLANRAALQWITLPGYPGANTMFEWQVSQSLENPYVTPYYLLRRFWHPQVWCYWQSGLRRTFGLTDVLSLTLDFFGDLGDDRHFLSQYGPRSNGARYKDGLMALNFVIRLDWMASEHLGFYAFVHQFDIVSGAGRSAMRDSGRPESISDLTIGGVGVKITF